MRWPRAWQYDKFLTREVNQVRILATAQASGSLFLVRFSYLPDFQLPGKSEIYQKFFENTKKLPESRNFRDSENSRDNFPKFIDKTFSF